MTHKEIKTIFETVLQNSLSEINIIMSYLNDNIIETFNKIIKLNKIHDIIECQGNILIISCDNIVYIKETQIVEEISIGRGDKHLVTITNPETYCVDDYLIYNTNNRTCDQSVINHDGKYKKILEYKDYVGVYFLGNYAFACSLEDFQISNIKTNEIYYDGDQLCFDEMYYDGDQLCLNEIVINFKKDALLLCVYKNTLFFSANLSLYILKFNSKHELILEGIIPINIIHDVCAYDNEFYVLSSYKFNVSDSTGEVLESETRTWFYINVYELGSLEHKRIIHLPETVIARPAGQQMWVNEKYMYVTFIGGVLILNRTKSSIEQRKIIITF